MSSPRKCSPIPLAEPSSDALNALLEGVGSIGEARRLYVQLPASFRSDVAAISPSQYVGHWSGGTVIRVMHDRGDAIIPVEESRRLVAALRQEQPDLKLYYTETDIFRHVIPDADTEWKPLLGGAWQVCRHMYHIIRVAQ